MRAGSLPAAVLYFLERRDIVTYLIKASYNGNTIKRTAYGDLQAWLIINQLAHDGCVDISMQEQPAEESKNDNA